MIAKVIRNIEMGNAGKRVKSGRILFKEIIVVSYRLNHLLYKDKIRFYYALKGRDGRSGMLKLLKASQLSKSVIIVEKEKAKEVADFLEHWKCPFMARSYFIKAAALMTN